MSRIILGVIVAIAVLAGGYVIFLNMSEPTADDSLGQRPGQVTDERVSPPETTVPTTDGTNGETGGPSQAEDELVDGTVVREWGDFIKGRDIRINCRTEQSVRRDVPGPDDYYLKCDHYTEFDHPYAQFTDAQLEQIADYDPEAAYLLAHRLLIQPTRGNSIDENPELGLTYAMRALIQTGEKQVFDLMIDGRHFQNWKVWRTVDGVPNDRQIREKGEEYIWYKVGHDLGFIEEDDYRWTRLSDTMQQFERYFDIEELNNRSKELSDGIAQERFAYSGERLK